MKKPIRNVKFKLSKLSLVLFSAACISQAQAADSLTPKQFLLQQVLAGEANYRDDLVEQALYRLDLIAPNDPEVIVARLRFALRKGNRILAEQLLDKLKRVAPNSEIYKQAQINVALSQPEAGQKLQQARLLAVAGKLVEAKKLYDDLFHGDPPTLTLAVEYWSIVARIPELENEGVAHLQDLYLYLQKNNLIQNNRLSNVNWINSLQSTLSQLLNIEGDRAFKAGNLALAQQKYQLAVQYDSTNDFAVIGLGNVAYTRKDYVTAEQEYKKAERLYPSGSIAVYGLIGIYRRQSPQKALSYLDSLPLSKQFKFKDIRRDLQSDVLQQQAERFVARKQWFEALQKYRDARQITPDDPWLAYHLAQVLHELKQDEKANDVLLSLVAKQNNNPKVIYVYALFLSSIKQDEKAIAYLNKIPKKLWDKDSLDLAQRIEKELVLKHARMAMDYAQKMRDRGNKEGANAYLLKQPKMPMITLKLADWALEDGKINEALAYYREVRAAEPQNSDALLGEIEALVAGNHIKEAHRLLLVEQPSEASLDFNMQRRVANAWIAVGEANKAYMIFQRIKLQARIAPPGMVSSLVFRDAANLERKLQQPQLARADYAEAMVKSQITSIYPGDNNTYTFLTRNHKSDDWLKRGIRSEAAQLYRQREVRITAEHDNWTLSGTGGTSLLTIRDDIIQADMPLYDGRAYARSDIVYVSAGNFATNGGAFFNNFGTCGINGCFTDIAQRAKGLGGSVGWVNDKWAVDVGETPLGFNVVNTVGGIAYSGSFNHVGWTLAASRRPMSNSLLSLAGARDPNTGIIWGGVVASGPSLSLSYDRGGSFGLWGFMDADQLTGKNVANNYRVRLMEGYYYKLINEDNARMSIGINNMLWHYQKDLSGYTLGQGGYYSPQSYLSFALPVDFRQRIANWSYEFGGSISWSTANNQNSLLYPLPYLFPPVTLAQNSIVTGGPNTGWGYTLLALVERRLGPHWTCGGVVNIQRTRDFTPSHISVYLRYSLDGWMGDLDMPLRPLVPYTNFS
ncbi:cellulose synthase complex outer membrane protein BcsC [Legionella fallonii]|uniref:Protein involved in cellulose synthesis (BcsC) n=1 Tax=Legionella fallonii LLAP-10 TaxID=1212491 RepID=A0A098G877_9GAMM|nr:cellulose synthase complex outer membrane protein BcsC [Legionella fallonii]CEG58688.1 protein involved in cellulose synthesis (BcsC) [Legionella fallonii LLAP-10]